MSAEKKDIQISGALPSAKKSIQQQVSENAPKGSFSAENTSSPWAASSYLFKSGKPAIDIIKDIGGRYGFKGQDILMQAAGPEGSAAMAAAAQKPIEEIIAQRQKEAAGWGYALKKENMEEAAHHNFNPAVSFLHNVSELYNRLDQAKVKGLNKLAIENAINSSPKLKKFFNDPAVKSTYPNVKDYLAQHYSDLIRQRDADYASHQKQQQTPNNQSTSEKITEINTPVSKQVKIKIQKK